MAATNQGSPANSKLENASKDDLIKLLKRQQFLSKKSNTERVAEKASLGNELSKLCSELESQRDAVKQLRKENEDIYNSNQQLTSEFQEMKEVFKFQEGLERSVKELKNEREDHIFELSVLKDNKEHMKGLLNVLQDSENELKRQVKDLESQIKSTSQENESKFDVLNDNITVLEQEIKESNRKLADAERDASLQKELYKAKNDIVSLKSEGDSLKSLIKEYNEQFTIETRTISQVLSSLGDASLGDSLSVTSVQDDLKTEIRGLKEQISELEKEDIINKKQISELQVLLEEKTVEREGDNTQDNLTDKMPVEASSRSDRERDSVLAKDKQLQEMGEELGLVSTQLDVSHQHIARLTEENETLALNLRAKEDALDITAKEQTMVSESERLLAEKAVELKTLKLREEIEISLAEKTSELEEFKLAFGNVEKVSGEREVERDALCKQVFVLEEQVHQLTSDLESEAARIETLEHSAKETAKVLSAKECEIGKLTDELKDAVETNNRLKEDTQGSHHLLDMELADYQRATDSLQEKFSASRAEVSLLEKELEKMNASLTRANDDVKELEKQRSSLDDMITKLKALLIKAKKDASDAKECEDDATKECEETKNTLQSTVQNLEDYKVELADVRGQFDTLKECSESSSEEQNAMLKNLESRLSAMQDEVEREKDLREGIGGQFESYKVRVHSVLKQQKTNESVIGIGEHEAIVIQLSKEVEMLKCQVHEMKETRDSVTSHRDCLEEELAAVLSNLEKVEQESAEKEKASMDRVAELDTVIQDKDMQILSTIQIATSQRAALTDSYTKTLEQANTSHVEASRMLQSRISRLESELSASAAIHIKPGPPETSTPTRPPRVRLGAEGMESPSPSVSVLEDILNNKTLSRSSSKVSLPDGGSSKEDGSRISHLSTLLSESEHNAAALQEQCSLLKVEVRRLENMIGRDNTNTEYLKNVVLKYLNAEAAGKEQLVPVLSTVLKLTRDEISLLSANASVGKHEQVPWTSTWFYSSS